MRKSALLAIGCAVLVGSLNCLAVDRKTLADLPAEAQASIKAALARDSATPNLTINDYTLTASDGLNSSEFGTTVAIDGNTVVVGAPQVASQGNGAVYVFVKPPGGWENMTQLAKLTASDGQMFDGLGCSVGISGNAVVAGACNATVDGNLDEGAAYVFVEPPAGWTNMTETAKLTASDGLSYAYFGQPLLLAAMPSLWGHLMEATQMRAPGLPMCS